jgi:hypothetical protein
MTLEQDYVPTNGGAPGRADLPRKAIRLEEELSDALRRTADEVARAQCLDEEQRAEVYTILDALRADTQTHCRTVGTWVSDSPQGQA